MSSCLVKWSREPKNTGGCRCFPPPPARAPLSARQGQCACPLGSGCRHPGALFPELLPSEKQVSVPGALPPAVCWPSPLCEQSRRPVLAGGAGLSQLWAVTSPEACPSVHPAAPTRLSSCDKTGWPRQVSRKGHRPRKGVAGRLCKAVGSAGGIIRTPPRWGITSSRRRQVRLSSPKWHGLWLLSLATGHTARDALLCPEATSAGPAGSPGPEASHNRAFSSEEN